MRKSHIALAAIAALSLVDASCGDDEETTDSATTESSAAAPE